MDLNLRLIYPYRLFKNYEEAAGHFRKHWRSDGGLTYEQIVKSGAWPPTVLQPNAAVFDGDVWLISVCLQDRLSSNEIWEEDRIKEQKQFGRQVGRVFDIPVWVRNRDSSANKSSDASSGTP